MCILYSGTIHRQAANVNEIIQEGRHGHVMILSRMYNGHCTMYKYMGKDILLYASIWLLVTSWPRVNRILSDPQILKANSFGGNLKTDQS